MMAGMFRRRKTPRFPPSVQVLTPDEVRRVGLAQGHIPDVESERIEFLWIRGAGRRIRIEVAPDGQVRVHSPAGASLGRVRAFVSEKAAWILRTKGKINSRTRLSWPVSPRAGDEFFWAGRLLRVEESAGPRFSIRIEADRFLLVRPPSGEAARSSRRAGLRLRAEAEKTLGDRMDGCLLAAAAFGLSLIPPHAKGGEDCPSSQGSRRIAKPTKPASCEAGKGHIGKTSGPPAPRVSFRMMKRRWGSCGRDGRVVLNLRLAQLPESCVDYVILHELCHLRHHHHGRSFYNLLARVCPDWKARKKLMEQYVLI
jgi:predicted metal-dependent hydrolase